MPCLSSALCCQYPVAKLWYKTTENLTDGILVLVGINAGVDHVVKEIVHDVSKSFSRHHAMQRADEHRLLRLQSLRRLPHVVTVAQHPRDYLYLVTQVMTVTH